MTCFVKNVKNDAQSGRWKKMMTNSNLLEDIASLEADAVLMEEHIAQIRVELPLMQRQLLELERDHAIARLKVMEKRTLLQLEENF